MKKQHIGIILMFIAVVIAAAETRYFGNNTFPGNAREWIADISCVALFILGYFIVKYNKN